MKKGKFLLSFVTVLVFMSSMAFANGLNLNGLGARAVAMGGAFVGLADDYSAIFWNPAGIAQFNQKTFGFGGDDILPTSTFKFGYNHPFLGTIDVDATSPTKHYLVGIAAYYHPINENLVAGIGVYTPSGLGADWTGSDFASLSYGNSYDWKSKIGVVTIAPALAYKVSDKLFVGAALNINYGMFDISTHAGATEAFIPPSTFLYWDYGQQDVSLTGWGYGATFGLLAKPSEMFSIGVTFRTPTKISFSGDAEISKFNVLGTIPGSPLFGATIPTTSEMTAEVTWPMWLAGGIAFKPIENLTFTADVQYTNWKKIDVLEFEFTDVMWQGIMAASEGNKMKMHWKDATQIRFGAEYKIKTFAFRGGYYFDPAPSPDETMNVLVPNYDFNGVTFGFGYALENGLHVDFSGEYLKGKDRDIPLTLTDVEMPGYYTLKIWSFGASLGYNW